MDVRDISIKKSMLEKQIEEMISAFEDEVGMSVYGLTRRIDECHDYGASHDSDGNLYYKKPTWVINIEIKI